MILEAVNSVFLTFIVTEYLLTEDDLSSHTEQTNNYQNNRHGKYTPRQIIYKLTATLFFRHGKFMQCIIAAVACLNLFMHFHVSGVAISSWIHSKVENLFHIPRILIAIASFLVALYFDCRRMMTTSKNNSVGTPNNISQWSNALFFRQLFQSFCILLPVYPFLAVVISFGFLFVVSIFEKLDLSLEILNMPIYYGTLYGPLSYLYWDVKKKMAAKVYVNGGVRILGGTVLPR